jgi:transposase-like protein
MKAGTDRKYTAEFRDAAVQQVNAGGRTMTAVARSLEMSNKTLANCGCIEHAKARRW